MATESGDLTVALPMEIKSRDLDGKIWLGLNLLERGHTVVIGQEDAIKGNLDLVEPDVYFAATTLYTEERRDRYMRLKAAGTAVFILDAEGGVYVSDEVWRDTLLSDAMLETAEVYFAWGNNQFEMMNRENLFPQGEVVLSGEPRFDLLQPGLRDIYAPEAARLRERLGQFVLVNTNFGMVNHADNRATATVDGDDVTVEPDPERLDSRAEKSSTFNHDTAAHKKQVLEAVASATLRLARTLEDVTLVVRPHPSEGHAVYEALADVEPSVVVEHSGDVRPWILASEATIHNSCTTGIESALLNVPVFAYRPVTSEQWDSELPNVVSTQVSSYEELLDGIRASVAPDAGRYEMDAEQTAALREYLFNIDGERAVERVVGAVDGVDRDRLEPGRLPDPGAGSRAKRLVVRLLGGERWHALTGLLADEERRYERQKFPGLGQEELVAECEKFLPHLSYESEDLRVEPVAGLANVYELSRC